MRFIVVKFQQRYVKSHTAFYKFHLLKDIRRCASLQIYGLFRGVSFGDRIPILSRSFSSEKSYSPSRLMCCQEIAEPWATASRNASLLAVSSISPNFCGR